VGACRAGVAVGVGAAASGGRGRGLEDEVVAAGSATWTQPFSSLPATTMLPCWVSRRVVVLGRGGAGKSTTATHLSLPVIELDKHFWSADLVPLTKNAWADLQRELAASGRWIMDGDLGPYDVRCPRLHRADTVVILDLSLARCAWRAFRRSRERAEFWWWLLTWRKRGRPMVLQDVAACAPQAELHLLRSPRRLRCLLASVAATHRRRPRT